MQQLQKGTGSSPLCALSSKTPWKALSSVGTVQRLPVRPRILRATLVGKRWSPIARAALRSKQPQKQQLEESSVAVHTSVTADALEGHSPLPSQQQRQARIQPQAAGARVSGTTIYPGTSTSGRDAEYSAAAAAPPPASQYFASVATSVAPTNISPRPLPSPSHAPGDLKFFLLGALAAYSANYVLTFIGTLPVVRALVRRFIWWGAPRRPDALSSFDEDSQRAAARALLGEEEEDGEVADVESVEWVNMCWRKAWRVYQRGLERWLADLLQPVFDNLVADGMVPRFILRLRILEFTLDHEAPYFSQMRRRNSRKDSDLNGVVDVRYTGGARMLLLLECGAGRWRIKVPIMVSDLDLECKMWVKIRLAPMCPYIGTMSLAFVGPPTIKVQLAPYNRVRLMRIPVLQPFLAKLLTVDLPALMTLPRRLEINIPPAVTAVAEAAVGRDAVMRAVASAVLQADALEHALISALPLGPQGAAGGILIPDLFQGELQVSLFAAKDLPVWGFPWQSNPYCRMALGSQAVRSRRDNETSQPSRHRAPVWNQEFQFLVEDLEVQALEIWVRDSSITGRTEVGYARVPLSKLPRDGTLDIWLPIESSMPGEKSQGAVHLALTYKPFQDDDQDSGYREAAAFAAMTGGSQEEGGEGQGAITDVKSAAAASSRAAVAASAAAAAVAVTKAAAARAAARLARGRRLGAPPPPAPKNKDSGNNNEDSKNGDINSSSNNGAGNGGSPESPLDAEAENATTGGLSLKLIPAPGEEVAAPDDKSNGAQLVHGGASEHHNGTNGAGTNGATNGSVVDYSLVQPPSSPTIDSNGDPVVQHEQEEAVQQLELMAATMQLLTEEVKQLNSSKAAGADAAAAEAAVKAVATAEALAVAAVAAGDIAAANRALQDAAAALETTVVKFATEDSGPNSISRIVLPARVATPSPQALTPQERAAQALAAAQAAAAAAAAAVEAADHQISENYIDAEEYSHYNTRRGGGGNGSDSDNNNDGFISDDGESLLAADAIPASELLTRNLSRNNSSQALLVSESDSETDTEETVAPWWSKALRLLPGMPSIHNQAADIVAEADGSAAVGPPGSGSGSTTSSTTTSTSSNGSSIESSSSESSQQPWWSGLAFWRRGGNGEGEQDATAAEVVTARRAPRVGGDGGADGGSEPVGDIILNPEIPLEEIAVEVQKSWKLRDQHVQSLVQKAMEGRQRQNELPWLVLTSIMATSSAVLLLIVLYRITQGQ